MFDEKGNEGQESSTDEDEVKPGIEVPEVMNVEDDAPEVQARPPPNNPKRRQQDSEGEEKDKHKQLPTTHK